MQVDEVEFGGQAGEEWLQRFVDIRHVEVLVPANFVEVRLERWSDGAM